MANSYSYDVLIIGSGAAGLSVAARLNPELSIAILSKCTSQEGSSYYAQGGVAAVMDIEDSTDAHMADTLKAGSGLCDEAATRFTVEHAKEAIEWLVSKGVKFDTVRGESGEEVFHLTQEGGHSHRRILHSADATGRAVSSALTHYVQQLENVDFFENHVAVDLVTSKDEHSTCYGAYVLDLKNDTVHSFQAKRVILATGGASKVYLYSSNPDVSSGDGIAIAYRAGARIANMEFNQFHPTCLFHPKARGFLITEALRGEGAKLRLPNGEQFMCRFDKRAELAPRDIVARAIDHEMKRLGAPCVYLDISHKEASWIESHFPTIYAQCLKFDIDIRKDAIPIVPAAHYTCGGILTDLNAQTDIKNLLAIGECTYTGLHGANRMASNSLLECLVFAGSAAVTINASTVHDESLPTIPAWDDSRVIDSDEAIIVSHNWNELRHFMWDYVGIVRSNKRLARAQSRIQLLKQEIDEYYAAFRISRDFLELRNLVIVADLIIRSAVHRQESRGLHFNIDFPETNPALAQAVTLVANEYCAIQKQPVNSATTPVAIATVAVKDSAG